MTLYFAYFNKDKLVGKINSNLYTLLRLNSNNINFSKNGNTVSVYKTNVKYEVKEDKVIIKICGDGLVKVINTKIDLEDSDSYSYLSRIISKDMKLDIESYIEETLKHFISSMGVEREQFFVGEEHKMCFRDRTAVDLFAKQSIQKIKALDTDDFNPLGF